MKESQMFEMDRKLQVAQKRYNKKQAYKNILEEMLEESGTEINNLNIDIFVEEYTEKLMKIK